jgi:GTP-binding protein LepA
MSSPKFIIIKSPQDLPDPTQIKRTEEPWMRLEIITPKEYLGQIMELANEKKAVYKDTKYLDETRVILHYEISLASLIIDFYDKLKSVSQGYASLNYEFLEYRPCEVVKLDILVAGEKIEALASIVYKDESYQKARKIVDSLKEVLPRQLFEVKIQGAIGGKIIASAHLPAMRKDVTAKLYGGDVTRKKKLLEKQKKGKRRMKAIGRVDIPGEVFRVILKS